MKFFTADTHFGKTKTKGIMHRDFESCLEMTEYIIEKINACCLKTDELYILGDFASEVPGRWLQAINCKSKFLIRGNHDPGMEKCRKVFGYHKVWDIKETKINGIITVMCHYPMFFWNKSHIGSFCLGGHIHNKTVDIQKIYKNFPEIKWLDVGVDSAKELLGDYMPFSEDFIYELLSGRQGHHFV